MLDPINFNRSLRQRFDELTPRGSIFQNDPFLRHFHDMYRDMDLAFDRVHNSMLSLEPFDSLGALTLRQFPSIHRDVFSNFFDDEFGRKAIDSWNNAYEVDEHGNVKFRVCYDVKGFPEENVKVTVENRQLKVEGKHSTDSGQSKTSSQFCRVISFPESVNLEQLSAERTNDGVLVITAPVHKNAISGGKHIAIEGKKDSALKKVGKNGISKSPDSSKIRIEFKLDAGVKKEDVKVSAQRFEVRVETTVNKKDETSTSCKTFSLTPAIDSTKSHWDIDEDTFVFEAPFDIDNKME